MASEAEDPAFEELLAYIRSERGFDYTGYKRASLMRRFVKRMQQVGVDSYEGYREYLEEKPDEFVELFNAILINVTAFFRDAPAWQFFREDIVPRLLEEKEDTEAIRIWSTGCASGEEAYTLAMVFAEALGEQRFQERVKIYATDIDEEALAEGRHALYSSKSVEPVPEELRDKYFDRVDSRFAFRPELRRSVIFGRHDLIQDPPISRIDLLAARNTLMYFTPDAQRRILANFHFALRDSGYLFLGKSEVLMTRSNHFVPLDLRRRFFVKVPRLDPRERLAAVVPRQSDQMLRELATDALMREVGFEAAPVAQLVIDREGTLSLANLQARTLFGITARDIGRPFKDLEVSFRPLELRSRIDQAYGERHTISLRDVEWDRNGSVRSFDVQITPLVAASGDTVGIGVAFADVTRYRALQSAVEASKRELESAYEELQSTVEELETTNEELQSTNEELETTNEELQSTNEELETMNEEMQSTNEELETMNDELNVRTQDLNVTNAFLESILSSLGAPIVVLDKSLRVSGWNAAARDLWGLRGDEAVGQHFMNLDIGLPLDELHSPVRRAVAGEHAQVTVHATGRRGQALECTVVISPLDGPDGAAGALLLMEASEDGA